MRAVDVIVHNVWVVFEFVSQRPTDWPFIFFLPILCGLFVAEQGAAQVRLRLWVKSGVLVVSILALVSDFWMGLYYLSTNFISNSNATLYAISSWLFCLGQPLYSGTDANVPYAEPYGPVGYMLVGAFQYAMGPTVFSSKLAPLLATFGSWIFLYLALRERAGWLTCLALTALAASLDTPFEPLQFWPRPDPFLLFAVGGGLWASTRREAWGPVLLGFFIGFAAGLKVYSGVFFILPLAEALRLHRTLRLWALATLVLVCTVLLPYAWPNISFENYIADLRINSGSPFQIIFGIQYAEWGVVIFLIGLSPLFINDLGTGEIIALVRRRIDILGALFISFVAVCYVACKDGPHHIMPFLPMAAYLAARLQADASAAPIFERTHGSAWGCMALSTIFFAQLLAVSAGIKEPRVYNAKEVLAREEIEDIRLIFREMEPCTLLNAAGSQVTHEDDFYRAILVFNGMPFGIDPAAAMDYKFFDRREPNLPVFIADLKRKSNKPIVWICPRGTVPFSLGSYYPGQENVFSEHFVNDFYTYFRLSRHSEYFDIYEEASD